MVEAWPAPEPLPALATTRDEALRFAQRFVAVPNARQALGQALAGQGPIDVTLDAQRYQGGQERHEHTFASGQALLSCLKDPADPRGPWAGPRSFGSCSLPKPLRQYLDSPRRFGQIVMDSCDDLCCTFAPSASVVQSALMLRRVCFDGVSPQRAVRRVELYGTW